MHYLRHWLAALVCLPLGCGGDDDRPEGAVSSGLPADRRLSELSDAQHQELCETFFTAVDEALAGQLALLNCTFAAVSASTGVSASGQVRFDVAMCEQSVSECAAGGGSGGSGGDASVPAASTNVDCATPAVTAAQRACDATVAQYERCYSALVADLDGLALRTDCEQALAVLEAGQSMTPVGPAMVPPPQCAELMELCPQISIPASRLAGP